VIFFSKNLPFPPPFPGIPCSLGRMRSLSPSRVSDYRLFLWGGSHFCSRDGDLFLFFFFFFSLFSPSWVGFTPAYAGRGRAAPVSFSGMHRSIFFSPTLCDVHVLSLGGDDWAFFFFPSRGAHLFLSFSFFDRVHPPFFFSKWLSSPFFFLREVGKFFFLSFSSLFHNIPAHKRWFLPPPA